jgi:hypothetical protein
VQTNLEEDPFAKSRHEIYQQFHPYSDGKSAERMVETVKTYIKSHGVPEKRQLSFLRQLKIHAMFGKPNRK